MTSGSKFILLSNRLFRNSRSSCYLSPASVLLLSGRFRHIRLSFQLSISLSSATSSLTRSFTVSGDTQDLFSRDSTLLLRASHFSSTVPTLINSLCTPGTAWAQWLQNHDAFSIEVSASKTFLVRSKHWLQLGDSQLPTPDLFVVFKWFEIAITFLEKALLDFLRWGRLFTFIRHLNVIMVNWAFGASFLIHDFWFISCFRHDQKMHSDRRSNINSD